MIEPFKFQHDAAAQIADRFKAYWSDRPWRGKGSKQTFIPFYQALASITASGKTLIVAQATSAFLPVLPLKPIVIWLSKGKVVVSQTLKNLQDGGKYRHLLDEFDKIALLADFDRDDVQDEELALVYLATVGTFTRKNKEQSDLRLFKSDIDNADSSTWSALKDRLTATGTRRPLFVVYDEAHNLTDLQTDLLMELEPDGFLLASATPKLPPAFLKIVTNLKEQLDWTDDDLITYVSSKDVVENGLVKRQVLLGGYEARMEEILDEMLADMDKAERDARSLGLPISPRAIYVCRTNIVEGNALTQDDPVRPFAQREAPPIVIWRYLVETKGVDPASIAVYTSALKFDRSHPPPASFVHFKGEENDYENFSQGGYRHVIFNLGLQEGWDEPECYFAFIDKSMQSRIQIKQIIGRVLRQPLARHFESEALNTAHFYVRVDSKGVFADIVKEVGQQLAADLPEIQISAYDPAKRSRPVPNSPKQAKKVPHVARDASAAREPIDAVIAGLVDFSGDSGDNIRGQGAKALVQQKIGQEASELVWVERDHNNLVSARWIFQMAVRRRFPLALEVTRSDDKKFDAKLELGSRAEKVILMAANQVVDIYLDRVQLRQAQHNPYVVGEVMVDPVKATPYKHALHHAYSGLNKLERAFATELDKTKLVWCRNPPRSGFGIPLLSHGQSQVFYPDFLVWKGNTVFALDTTGEFILQDKLGRKLLAIERHPKSRVSLRVRLVSEGYWNDDPKRVSGKGYTVWSLGNANALHPIHVETMAEAVAAAVFGT